MPRKRILEVGLAGTTALLMLAGCNTPSFDDLARVENDVTALRNRVEALETGASDVTAAANRCTETCEANTAQMERIHRESLQK